MSLIHASAIIDPKATLGSDVTVGPYCIVGQDVHLHDRVKLHSHVVVDGRTDVGEDTQIYPFSSIGLPPQDLKYKGEDSELVIGKRNTIREYVTMNPGTEDGGMRTIVGDDCLFMASTHVAHDCIVGNNVIMANNATLAGHVEVGDFAIIGGLAAVHQFARIGRHAIVGGMTGVENNVIPYGSVVGDRARLSGLNVVGLKRRAFSKEDISNLRTAYRMLFAEEGTLAERIEVVANMFGDNVAIMEVITFMKADSPRGLTQPR
ncbi:MAG: acyl-ACP--UDP-N-acetylglucosamine O-acyltransferase [Rhodospirillaceae bacterium]|jgi:UDP-N-acetylglucosamine acyltransferase|nr:acyl-ACP--UDP-N-acetylglucosamine O-acyltransferase [Rhodospirillaceae bacterium]MBT5809081.1 acyl-ACP--UDP-N-acetylglucosamine O-acyltransferase [Rhodospirillaceae bacterium]